MKPGWRQLIIDNRFNGAIMVLGQGHGRTVSRMNRKSGLTFKDDFPDIGNLFHAKFKQFQIGDGPKVRCRSGGISASEAEDVLAIFKRPFSMKTLSGAKPLQV